MQHFRGAIPEETLQNSMVAKQSRSDFVAMHKAFKGPNQGCIIYCIIDFDCTSRIVAIANNNILGTLIARIALIFVP